MNGKHNKLNYICVNSRAFGNKIDGYKGMFTCENQYTREVKDYSLLRSIITTFFLHLHNNACKTLYSYTIFRIRKNYFRFRITELSLV